MNAVKVLSIAISLAIAISGCGGGGGGASGSGSNGTQLTTAPVINLGSSVVSAYQGDSIDLVWTSTNATSCTASGGWSATVATAGTQTVTASALGGNTFNLTCSGNGQTATAQVVVTTTDRPYFAEVSNALQFSMPYALTEVVTPVAIDINHDGKNDFVMHMWSKPTTLGVTNTAPCLNQLKIFIKQTDGTFSDQTSIYVDGSTELGGCSRKVRVADINGDGKSDLIYAINQEDGRNQTNVHDMDAQMAALVSVGSKYVVQKFGPMNWYHSIGNMVDSVGNNIVVGYGYTSHDTPRGYQAYANGNVSQTNIDVPPISPTSFEFLADGVLGRESNMLLQASNITNEYNSVEGYYKSNGQWNRLQSLDVGQVVGFMDVVGWTGSLMTNMPVLKLNNKYLTVVGMSETCQIKLTPTSDPIALFNISGGELTNYTPGMTARQNDLSNYSTFVAATIRNNRIVQVPINISTQQINSWSFSCKDVNGDGYDDIVVYPINSDGLPYIYLNDKNNGFSFVGKYNLPSIANLNSSGFASSLLQDFDGDGIPDLLVFPIDQGAGSVKFRYFKGMKYLK